LLIRIIALSKKELRQIRRDGRTLMILLVFPVFMLIVFGYALNFDVTGIRLGVYDLDRSDLSREFVNSLRSTEYFHIVKNIENYNDINKELDEKRVQCVIVIPDDLTEKYYSKERAKIQYLIDGVEGNTATIIMNYVNAATRNLSAKSQEVVLARSGLKTFVPVELEPIFWYNPELKTTRFLIPGLVAVLLITLSVVLTAVAIVREKELGTIEQINVSPVSAIELLLGKIVPYTILSLIVAALILLAGYLVFGVQIKGSMILLLVSTLLYLFASLSMGILVSTLVESQQAAFQIGMVVSQLPSNLLSGFIFPIESMPPIIQIMTNMTPAKFYIKVLRAILIKGAGMEAFWDQLIYLVIFAIIALILASIRTIKQRA
jgi:ABC-2 type transport system permease protein